ncbi:MAG: hypothetical protein SGBAC_013362, partial [Bacillariaceae sp.]
LGWLTPQKPQYGVNTISDSATTPDCIKIGDGEYGYPEGEYLLIENRQPKGLDSKLPQGGLAIFHIDEKIKHDLEGHPGQYGWPLNGRHYKVALLQADGQFELERQINHGDGDDLYHGDGVDKLLPSESTTRGPFPNTDSYQRGRVQQTGIEIYGISKSNATMTFIFTDGKVELPSAQPSTITTSSATATPSGIPTTSPVPTVTAEPTLTASPTKQPSPSPTTAPSVLPSNLPSVATTRPTAAPSLWPSVEATAKPTALSTQCFAEKGQECQNPKDCCNDKAECRVMDKRQKKKVCSK